MLIPLDGIHVISYADDCTVFAVGNDINTLYNSINNQHVSEVGITLPNEINGCTTLTTPRILGVILNPLLNFNAHAAQTRSELKSRNHML